MKISAIFVLSTVLFATSALAEPAAFLTKSNWSGLVHPEWDRSEQCQLFTDKVVISKKFGALVTVEEKALRLSLNADQINELVQKAAMEKVVETKNNMCDGPETNVTATLNQTNGTKTPVVLFATGGCGNSRKERSETFSHLLRDLIDVHCPKTHDRQ